MEENITLQLKDIKPLLEIPDFSYYYYWGLIVFGVCVFLGLAIFLVFKFWKKRKVNLAKGYLEALKKIEWKESKKAAYEATHYARLLMEHDSTLKDEFKALEPLLEQFKYKKEVDEIDVVTKEKFDKYVQVADERI